MKIEIIDVEKNFNELMIFKGLNITIENGEFIAIVGKSGRGKSTLLNIIGLLEKYDTGAIIYDGNEVSTRKDINKFWTNDVSFLFQNYALIDNETVYQNLEIATKGIHKKKRKILCIDALKKFNLEHLIDKKVYQLSGGEQQRVALARVFLKDSPLILADEPTGNLDEENAQFIFSELKRMSLEGKTVLVVTHDINLAKQCDRIIEL